MRKVVVGGDGFDGWRVAGPARAGRRPHRRLQDRRLVAPLADVDPVFGAEIGKLFAEPFDLLLGRKVADGV